MFVPIFFQKTFHGSFKFLDCFAVPFKFWQQFADGFVDHVISRIALL